MKQEKLAVLGRLNAYQIAGLSIVMSTAAALGVLFTIRRWFSGRIGPRAQETASGVGGAGRATPEHFSEDLLLPGITHTGDQIRHEDSRAGRSPEGV